MSKRRGRPKSDAPRTASGRLSRAHVQTRAERDAVMQTVLEVRARHLGTTLTPDNVAILRQPMLGCIAGRAIRLEPDAPELWQTILNIRATRRAYCAALGMADEAPTSRGLKPNSEFPPDAEPVDPPSYAPEEERHCRAVEAWEALSARIFAVHPMAVRYVLAVVIRDEQATGEVPLARILREIVK